MVAYTRAEARENIERGMPLLDREFPGWLWQVAPDFLRMEDGCQCVLGQIGVLGTYADAIERLWPDVGDDTRDRLAHDHGFVVGAHLGGEDGSDQPAFRMLTTLWRQMIEDRRAESTGVRVSVAET